MIKTLLIIALLLVFQAKSCEPRYVTMRAQQLSNYLPYEFDIQIPDDYNEIECYRMSGQSTELHITFSNGGYVYLSQHKYIPNTGRIKSIGNEVYYQRFGFLTGNPKDIYNPNGEELVLLDNEGKDSEGLFWRDVHYIFPDSLCYVQRRGNRVRVEKDSRFRLSLGYSNVPYEEKEMFDRIIESVRINSKYTLIEDCNRVTIDDTISPRIRHLCVMPSVDEIWKQ